MNGHDSENNSASSPRELFDRAVHALDPATGNRLRLMRRDALSASPRRGLRTTWALGTGLVAVIAIAVLTWLPSGGKPASPAIMAALPAETAEEPEALAADEDQDLYVWLADAPVATEPKPENPL